MSFYTRPQRPTDAGHTAEPLQAHDRQILAQILTRLRTHTGQDLSGYEETTLIRRIQRRMRVVQANTPQDYLDHLRGTPAELDHLLKELLVGVTQFLRDGPMFESLATDIIPELCDRIDHTDHDEPLRIWVPACRTGEEAYSIAILLLEAMRARQQVFTPQLFATDLDVTAVEVARTGIYAETVKDHLAPDWLERYFSRHPRGYQINPEVRQYLTFGRHNLARDPPFARLDLIYCLNGLLGAALQQRLLPLFHYALNPEGYLILGPNEHVTGFEDLFQRLATAAPVYQRMEPIHRPRLEFPPADTDAAIPAEHAGHRAHAGSHHGGRLIERLLVAHYSPPCVVVNTALEALYFYGDISRYLTPPCGAASNHIANIARHGLRGELRTVLQEAIRTRQPVIREDVPVKTPAGYARIRLTARPAPATATDAQSYLLIFEERTEATAEHAPPEGVAGSHSGTADNATIIARLETELELAHRHLLSAIEEGERANEDLKSSNEELLSMNEELRCTLEALDVSKQEVQSINEELEAVNAEFNSKIGELARAHSDARNLIESTRIATLVLDNDLHIKSFTPPIAALFNLIDQDVGRPIEDISPRHDHAGLTDSARLVLTQLTPVQQRIHSTSGDAYLMRILPYRTERNVIAGVVITFAEITELAAAQCEIETLLAAAHERADELETMLALLPVGVALCDGLSDSQARINRQGASILGLMQTAARDWDPAFGPFALDRYEARELASLQRALATGAPVDTETHRVRRPDGASVEIESRARPLYTDEGELRGAISVFSDVSHRRHADYQQKLAEMAAQALSDNDVGRVLRYAVGQLHETLRADLCNIWRYDPRSSQFEFNVGRGWDPPPDTALRIPAAYSFAEHILQTGKPVAIVDLTEPQLFHYPELYQEQGITSALGLPLHSRHGPYGVLTVLSRHQRRFTDLETSFLESVATLLQAVLQRKHLELDTAEAARRQIRAAAEDKMHQAERLASLGTLAAGIAHEINNPLNSIMINAELAQVLIHGGQSPDKLHQVLKTIIDEAQRGGSITRNVLEFSKSERQADRNQTDLNGLIRHVQDLVASLLREHETTLELDLDADLPALAINATTIEQALVNLVANAAQAGATHITLVTTHTADTVTIRINDDGRGIDEHEIPRLFDPFYTSRREQGGSGLGLSLVHRIISDHDGSVDVQSRRGAGTGFVIRLPREG